MEKKDTVTHKEMKNDRDIVSCASSLPLHMVQQQLYPWDFIMLEIETFCASSPRDSHSPCLQSSEVPWYLTHHFTRIELISVFCVHFGSEIHARAIMLPILCQAQPNWLKLKPCTTISENMLV